jgi:hypothetical protein
MIAQQKQIQVLLLNRDATVRSTLARLLEREPGLQVSEGISSGKPDVVVVNANDEDHLRSVRQLYPQSRILARVSILRPHLRANPNIDAALDSIAPYEQLVETIREMGPC